MVSCNYKGKTSYGISSEDMLSEQVLEEHGAMNNGEQVNDHIEEDDYIDNIVEDDGANTLIHYTFNVRMDDDDDDHENDEFDDVHNLPLLEKEYEPLYEDSNTNILSAILLIMNLKVMNEISNTLVTRMLRHAIYSITYI